MTESHGHSAPSESWPQVAPADFWEDRYSGSGQVWSGRVNATLADVAATLAPGRALDLGCGEGADAIWLAQHGWRAVGVDISPTAVARATEAARAAGLTEEQVRFRAEDLGAAGWADADAYDLVAASFFHSPVEHPRVEILRRAAGLVVPGGHLLVVSHAAPPPWADASAHEHRFLSAREEVDGLALPADAWETVIAEQRHREATGPDDIHGHLEDTVVLLRRR